MQKKQKLRKSALRGKSKTFLLGLGFFGIIGWAIAIPALAGVAVGLWVDKVWKDPIPWSVVCLLIGLIIGCLNAWYWISQERQQITKGKSG